MIGFKLIGIRPLCKCGDKFLKNLNVNSIYKFHANYEFYNSGNRIDELPKSERLDYKEVDNIFAHTSLPNNFYSPKINISAIVGKNGSGKSSIVDLFIASINQLSLKLRDNGLLFTTASLISTGNDEDSKIHCEIFYEINGKYYILIIDDDVLTLKDLEVGEIDFDFNKFFYSEVISYSIYAFNSWEVGDWIDNLFHKNDSYQIPIVINPKRESKMDGMAGMIDINNESYLLQQRLLSVILTESKYIITNNLLSKYLKIYLKNSKPFFVMDDSQNGREYEDEKEIEEDFYKILNSGYGINFKISFTTISSSLYGNLNNIINKFKIKFGIADLTIPKLQYRIDNYILYKIISICEKYVSYKQFIVEYKSTNGKSNHTINIEGFLDKIENNQSHILFKLNQVVNFIKNYNKIWKRYNFEEEAEEYINIDELSIMLNQEVNEKKPMIELLPPPIFETKLFSNNKIDLLERISSGERQLIHSTSTILYHLINLNSVVKDQHVIKYKYVNIILDEIELYFHPEFQKKFIKKLIEDLKILKINHIKGINIMVISHSPFILSDIPKENVLFLDKGSPVTPERFKNANTFAANISDLLADSFFIDNGLIGDYAMEKINETIQWLNKLKKLQDKQGTGTYIKSTEKEFNELAKKREQNLKLINMIDEPIIRGKLHEMYSNIFGNQEKIKYLLIEKERIEQEIQNLQSE